MDPNYATILQANVVDVIKMVEKDGRFVVRTRLWRKPAALLDSQGNCIS